MLTAFLLVGDDILGVPRIRRNVFNLSVRYASSSPGRRASLLVMIPLEKAWLRFPLCIVFFTLSLVGVGARFDILIVGTVRPYLLCKLTVLKIGRALGKPQVCFANIVHAPTDLMVVLKFVCRGGYYPPAIYKNIIAFCTGSRGRLPLQVLCAFDIFDCRGDHWSSVIY